MKLQRQLRERIRVQGKSKATYDTYWHWCRRFLVFVRRGDKWVHPLEVGEPEVEAWLTQLANGDRVSKNTQNVALNAVCYLYREVLRRPLVGVSAVRAKRPQQMRDVLDVSEVARLLAELSGVSLLVARLIYGCGLRIGDVARLRIKDISFERRQLHIHTAKGDKGRYTAFPEVLHDAVRGQIESMRVLHRWDLQENQNGVSLPDAFRRKSARAATEFRWYYLFCSDSLSRDEGGPLCRHHRDRSHLAREIKHAANRAEIDKRVTSHVLRHSYATHANEQGVDVTLLQQLLGHSDVRTTMIYVHANKDRATSSRSPLTALESELASPRRKEPAVTGEPARLRIFAG